jgi:hypothetical protein
VWFSGDVSKYQPTWAGSGSTTTPSPLAGAQGFVGLCSFSEQALLTVK